MIARDIKFVNKYKWIIVSIYVIILFNFVKWFLKTVYINKIKEIVTENI